MCPSSEGQPRLTLRSSSLPVSIAAAARFSIPRRARLANCVALEKIGPAPSAAAECGLVALFPAVEDAIVGRAVVETAPGGRGLDVRSSPPDRDRGSGV